MSSFLFLTCCILIIIACSEGAVTDAKKLETRQTCSTNDFPSGCTLSDFSLPSLSTSGRYTDSQLNSLNQQYSRICTKACVDAVTEFYRCYYDQQQEFLEYQVNLAQKYICGQHNGKYCPVQNANITVAVLSAYRQVQSFCTTSSANPYAITCSSSTMSNCTNAISTVSSYMGCCAEPFFGSGVRSCSGVSVPEACTATVESSATGIKATAPIVAVSLMVFALVGVLL